MKSNNTNISILLIMAIAAFSRLIPHMPNFTPAESVTIFGAAYFSRKYLAFVLPIVLLYITDFVINNTVARPFFTSHEGLVWFSSYMLYNTFAIILIVLISTVIITKVNFKNVAATVLASTLIFYLVTNFGAWAGDTSIYPRDLSGLITSYIAGLPFLKNTLISNILFATVLFGSYTAFNYFALHKQNSIKA